MGAGASGRRVRLQVVREGVMGIVRRHEVRFRACGAGTPSIAAHAEAEGADSASAGNTRTGCRASARAVRSASGWSATTWR